ncbi:MAG: hypothetical protein ACFNTM_05060 [Cardiobacterium sp.]
MPGNHPQPQLQPEPRREKPQQKHLFPALITAALVIGLGGWGLTRFFDDGNSGGVPASAAADNLTQAEKDARAQQFAAVPRYALRRLDATEARSAIQNLPLPDDQKTALAQNIVPTADSQTQAAQPAWDKGGQQMVELVLWDNVAEDGDVVQVSSLGYSQTITITHAPQTVYFPAQYDVPVTITGIHDGGGGITLGFTGSGQPVSLPVMTEGQVISLYLQ